MRTRQFIFGTFTGAVLLAAVLLAAPSHALASSDPSPALARPPPLASGVSEVMKMFQSGLSADIIVGYINTSRLSFYLSADNIIYMQQQGVPSDVIKAIFLRYGQLQPQTGMPARVPAQPPPQAPPPRDYSDVPVAPPASYVEAPAYPVYPPVYYDSYYYGWYPTGGLVYFGVGRGHVGRAVRGPVVHGGVGGRVANVRRVARRR